MAVVMGKEGPAGLWGCLLLGVKEEAPSDGWEGSQGDSGRGEEKGSTCMPCFSFCSPTQP